MIKQILAIRKDLNMRKGKCVAQGAHASLGAYLFANRFNPQDAEKWMQTGHKKICVGVESEQELHDLHAKAMELQLPTFLVRDAGLTEFTEPTFTAIAIGPAPSELIDTITGKLKLL